MAEAKEKLAHKLGSKSNKNKKKDNDDDTDDAAAVVVACQRTS
jgi:hypothetical protein